MNFLLAAATAAVDYGNHRDLPDRKDTTVYEKDNLMAERGNSAEEALDKVD
jgi:hypothetical protein